MLKQLFQSSIQDGLKPVPAKSMTLTTDVQLWQCLSFNSNRAVALLTHNKPFESAAEVIDLVRGIPLQQFGIRSAWFRGFAFGVFVEAPNLPGDAERLEQCIDTQNNPAGTLQWLIYVSHEPKIAFGVHTWADIWLSKTFRSAVASIEASGLNCDVLVRDKGAFFKFASKIGRNPFRDFVKD